MTIDWYVEVSDGVIRQSPPKLIRLSELEPWQIEHQGSIRSLFRSVFTYAVDDPYVGGVLGDFYMDFDCEENPDNARKEALMVAKKFILEFGIPEDVVQIAFSGLKGISLTVDYKIFDAELLEYLPRVWRSIAEELKEKLKLKTVDSVIYERRRLWRLVNSRHQKSGLYKTPLTLRELEMPVKQIMELAKTPRKSLVPITVKPNPKAKKLFQAHKRKVEKWIKRRRSVIDTSKFIELGDDPPCVKRRLELGAEIGQRNPFLFQLAVYYAMKGLPEADICKIGYGFAAKCKPGKRKFPHSSEIESTVASAHQGVQDGKYSIGCSSEAFADLCDKENCALFGSKQKAVNSQQKTLDDIGKPITFEEWREVIMRNYPYLWPYAEICASTVIITTIKDAQPVAVVLQGVPGSGKTTTLIFFRGFPHSYLTDKFTPRSFVTHVAQKEYEELEKIDLLPRIRNKTLITPDLNTLFGAKTEELTENFSILTRVLDGQGLTIDSGVYGSRGYSGDYMFTWIGATTPIPHNVWSLFGNLGARMYFVYVSKKYKTKEERVKDATEKPYLAKLKECNEATLRFLKGIWREEKTEWDRRKDPKEIVGRIVDLANLVVRLRGKINVSVKEEWNDKTYWTEPIIEEPERAIEALYALARGHALIRGRTQITFEDLPAVISVALSSAPWDRVIALAYLLNRKKATTKDFMGDLKCTRSTALRKMRTLELLEIANLEKEQIETTIGERASFTITLKEEFKWFTTGEFKKLWRMRLTDTIKTEETEEELTELKMRDDTGRMGKVKMRRWLYHKSSV